MASSMASPLDLPRNMEMFQRAKTDSVFFPRPASTYTDFFDMDVEDMAADDSSDFEEDSPRESFDSYGLRSMTTATSYEIPTPAVEQKPGFDNVRIRRTQSVQGPVGPHLFRHSSDSTREMTMEVQAALQMSPLVMSKTPIDRAATAIPFSNSTTPRPHRHFASSEEPDYRHLEIDIWTTADVAAWMHSVGTDDSIISKFETHDVDGQVLLELHFDDLKELDIPSFGKRHQIWNAICQLKANGTASPVHTPIHDDITNPLARSRSVQEKGTWKTRRTTKPSDHITPQESISIVAIEQYIPPEHHCPKGDKCPKFKQRERLKRQFERDYPNLLSPKHGGQFFIAGDPGNAATALAIDPDSTRATSQPIPSVVASSDVLGPGLQPDFALQEEHLRNVQKRDPQENVKQFLTFQHIHPTTPDNTPPSPPADSAHYSFFAGNQPTTPQRQRHMSLPRLSIPVEVQTIDQAQQTFSAGPHLANGVPQRFGTPASEADIPITLDTSALPVLDRDASQSVPPNMQFRPQIRRRPESREAKAWHRSSMVLPSVPESAVAPTPGALDRSHTDGELHLSTPIIRVSQPDRHGGAHLYSAACTHAGWMKKRRNRLLRHEWTHQHFRLEGTQLAMHASADAADRRALETIDVDDYAVACSSLAANNKLAAALKTLKINGGKPERGLDDSAFIFQLVPTAVERAGLLKMMMKEGAMASSTHKTHHFAVKTGDERIDWMREVMLAKAMRAKVGGKQVVINEQEV